MQHLLQDIQNCRVCASGLPHGCRPVIQVSAESKILIIGQAPGLKVHQTGVPWDDASGENLRRWLGVSSEAFYNPAIFGLLPMGFCYPGTGKSGDLPPRRECAPLWHPLVRNSMHQVELTLLVGKYAQQYYLPQGRNQPLTDTVRNFRQFLPAFFPLPHPSPRNNIWQARNQWFAAEVLPELRRKVKIIAHSG